MNRSVRCLAPAMSFLAIAVGRPAPGLSDVTIDLEGLPEWVVLPLPAGKNLVLTIRVSGPVDDVWIAATADAADRFKPTRVAEGAYQLNLGSREFVDFLAKRPDAISFAVFARAAADGSKPPPRIVGSVPVFYDLRLPPARLDFPWDKVTLTIPQRSSKPLPGSHGYFQLHLADITHEQVLLEIRGKQDETLVETLSVRERQAVPFTVAQQRFIVTVDKLVNLLVGQDYAVLTVWPENGWEQDRIERLLQAIESSQAVFIRNGREYTPAQAVQHMRDKLGQTGGKVLTAEQFIEQVASKSSISGQPYRLRLPDGREVTAAEWLREQLAAMQPPPPPSPEK